MSGYTTPVTDRTSADIVAKNSKAYFNVADWTRIYRNAQITNSLVEIFIGSPLLFLTVQDPTILSIPFNQTFNALLTHIETFRTASPLLEAVAPDEIFHAWQSGPGQLSPKYTDVNLWETTIDAVWTYLNGSSYPSCPTLSADLVLLTATSAIYIGCIDEGAYDIDLQGTSKLFIF